MADWNQQIGFDKFLVPATRVADVVSGSRPLNSQ